MTQALFYVLWYQILTSAQLIPVLVMRTLIVPTLTVLSAAPVSQDLLTTALFVKVCMIYNQQALSYTRENIECFFSNPCLLDIDECSIDPRPCDENADCANSDGSYSCTCKQGFTGNGTICEGMQEYWHVTFHKCAV